MFSRVSGALATREIRSMATRSVKNRDVIKIVSNREYLRRVGLGDSKSLDINLRSILEKIDYLDPKVQNKFAKTIPSMMGPNFRLKELFDIVCNLSGYRESGTLEPTVKMLSNNVITEMLNAGMSRNDVFSLLQFQKDSLEELVSKRYNPLEKFKDFKGFFRNHLTGDIERIATFITILNKLPKPHQIESMDHGQLSKILSRQMRSCLLVDSIDHQKQFEMVENRDPHFWNQLYRSMYKALRDELEDKGMPYISEDSHQARVIAESHLANRVHPHEVIKKALSNGPDSAEFSLIRSHYGTRSKDTLSTLTGLTNSRSVESIVRRRIQTITAYNQER